jgi:hypothetical protein
MSLGKRCPAWREIGGNNKDTIWVLASEGGAEFFL